MSPHQRLVPFALAVAAGTVVLLGGCSSGSSGAAAAGATSPNTASSTQAATSPAADVTGSVTDATDTPADTSVSAAGTSDGAADTSGSKVFAEPTECGSIAQMYGSVSSAMMEVLQGKTGPTPFDAEALIQAVDAETMGAIPVEVAPDFAAFKAAGEQLRGKDLTAAAALLNSPEISKAAGHLDRFLSDHC